MAFILFSGSGYIRCAVSISRQASEFLSMEIIYESDSIKNIFPLESTPYINIVHVHMLVSVHLLNSRKRLHFSSDCFAQPGLCNCLTRAEVRPVSMDTAL